jgi:hypothetical protein
MASLDEIEPPVPPSPDTPFSDIPDPSIPNTEILGLGNSLINKPSDSRPQVSGYLPTGSEYISKYETENSNKIMREYKQKVPETILTMTLNDIIENTVYFLMNFMNDYSLKLYEVKLDYKLSEEPDTYYKNIKHYFLAIVYHLQEKDNIIYFGIVLVTLSIILYFFNITSG